MAEGRNIFVAGLGRCGTTMVMTMLARGGFPVIGEAPDYEPCEAAPPAMHPVFLERCRGAALKWIDPTVVRIPPMVQAKTIWLDRDLRQQAASQLKLMGVSANRSDRRRWEARVRADAVRARAIVALHGPVLALSFEQILWDPRKEAARIADFLGPLDIERAAAAVIRRSPECRPDLSIEGRAVMEARHG